MMTTPPPTRHIGLQFGHIKHFNEGLSEFARQLGMQFSQRALFLKETLGWQFHFILPKQWHGLFGDAVTYHDLTDAMRWRHRFPVDLDIWHGLHQHMRYRPPVNSRHNIITVHDLNHVHVKHGASLWWQNVRTRRHLNRAHQLVAITRFVAHDLAHYFTRRSNAPLVIYNGVANLSHSAQEPVADLQDNAFLLHISRMSPTKNVRALIEMAAKWPEQAVVLAGPEGEEVDKHRIQIANQGICNVRIITNISEAQKAWLYAHCRAFLFPSLLEGFGLPPIEAMFFGKPVVVAKLSCLPEVCGQGAAYWSEFDPSYMRNVVQQQIRHCEQDPENGRLIVKQAEKYSWSTARDQYLHAYEASMAPC